MNEQHLIELSERLIFLYEADRVITGHELSSEFRSLIGDLKDAVSRVE